MNAYEAIDLRQPQPRPHPWTVGQDDPNFRYYDFKKSPDLIPEVLEDFKAFREKKGMECFFELLRWLNGPESIFESNDCGAKPLRQNDDPISPLARAQTSRLMILYRHIPRNLDPVEMYRLMNEILKELLMIDTAMPKEHGVIGLVLDPAGFFDVPGGDPEMVYFGQQLTFHFWTWGSDDDNLFENFGRLCTGLRMALQISSQQLKAPNGSPSI